ncbi:glycosyltransferase family 39 protein [Streptomyces sp. NPDC088732]|uniref:glycosyltransferase family 39 protein n=1 Tax=Streptomyces sp. NPDC088732 TaxID=3365879 RepID=UPI003828C0EE
MPSRSRNARPAAPARAFAGDRFWLPLLPLLTLLAALVHLPSFLRPVWNPDEGFLATQARMLAAGGVLYDTVVDRKPPLLPWLYQGAFAVFGDDSLRPLRCAAVAAHVVTAALLAALARRRWGDRWGAAAGAAYVLLSVGLAPEDTQAASFEVFTLPWTAAAVLLADRRRWGLAGLAVAGAALTKQTGAAVLLPVAWSLWRTGRAAPSSSSSSGLRLRTLTPSWAAGRADGMLLRAAAGPGALPRPGRGAAGGGALGRYAAGTAGAWGRLLAGCALPVAVVAAATGTRHFVFWTLTGSSTYMSPQGAWLLGAGRGLGNAAILLAAGAGLLVPALWWALRRRRFADADLWVWLVGSVCAVVAGFQFYGHYYLQLLPPLVLIGIAAVRALPSRGPARRLAAAWTLLAAAVFTAWGLAAPRAELDHAQAVAAAVRDRSGPRDTVLLWGMHPEQYWLADRAPACRYLTAGFLTNFSGGRGGARVGARYAVPGAWDVLREEFAGAPPALVVDDSRGAPYGAAAVPEFRDLLAQGGYTRVGTVDGAVLYARRGRG